MYETQESYRKSDRYKRQMESLRKDTEERDKYMSDFYDKYSGKIPAEKLQIIHKSHTHFSMIKMGVFPKGKYTIDEIRKEVRGTFGGRFTHFGECSFEYIAYTD